MCELLDFLGSGCGLAGRSRAEDSREPRTEAGSSMPPMSPGEVWRGTIREERLGLPESLFATCCEAFSRNSGDTSPRLSEQRGSWGEWRDFVAS